jgi:putative pyruvate formate lyase activating enzyme
MPERALARYYRILQGEVRALYLLAKEASSPGRIIETGNGYLLDLKIDLAEKMLGNCMMCERKCGADRSAGERGHCGVLEPRISTEFIHMGEEPDLVPSHTVFFAGCTFNCVFCQNWDISTDPSAGTEVDPKELARRIEKRADGKNGLRLGASRNVNWVGGEPTPNLHFILRVLKECDANIPQVWNSNMYMSEDTMDILEDVVDVYLADYKFGSDDCARLLSGVEDYSRIVQRNLLRGRAHAEMIIRHLILPGHVDCCTRPVLNWIAENLKDVRVNVMAQYRPEHKARGYPGLDRSIRMSEYQKGLEIAESLHLDLCD